MKIASHIVWLGMALILAGCVNPNPSTENSEDAEKYQGREETKSLQNADNIGYDGTGIQKKLDKALDQNDHRASDIDAQIEAQSADPAEQEAE
jgi:PBP1b-binding outer membrane lipoprotein LpoB